MNRFLTSWKEYDLPDNGMYGPKGSNPKFYPTDNRPLSFSNARGYISHDKTNEDDIIKERIVLMGELIVVNDNLNNES